MWDCIYGPLSTMLYVFLMQIALDQLSSGAEINTIAATLFFFFICGQQTPKGRRYSSFPFEVGSARFASDSFEDFVSSES